MSIMQSRDKTPLSGTSTLPGTGDPGLGVPPSVTPRTSPRIPGVGNIMLDTDRGNLNDKITFRIGTWNIGSMTGRGLEIVQMMNRRRMDILCVQEIKWSGEKARMLEMGYKLYYKGDTNKRNGVGIIVSEHLVQNVIETKRISDRLISVKLAMSDKRIMNIISAYAPQTGCRATEIQPFWSDLEDLLQAIPPEEQRIVCGDFNAHVGKNSTDYAECCGPFGYGTRNKQGIEFLDIASAYGLIITNTLFQKKDEHLITYKSGGNKTQIDYILCDMDLRKYVKDSKVIPGEPIATQHRLLLADMRFPKMKIAGKEKPVVSPKIRWWRIKEPEGEGMVKEICKWLIDDLQATHKKSVNNKWDSFEHTCKQLAINHLGMTKGRVMGKEGWWWNTNIKDTLRQKKLAFQNWSKTKDDESIPVEQKVALREEYSKAKKNAKRAVAVAKDRASRSLLEKLQEPGGANQIYKIAAMRTNNSKDITRTKYIESSDKRLLTNDKDILNRWVEYSHDLLNTEFPRQQIPSEMPIHGPIQEITTDEVKVAIKAMKNGKATGPDDIPAEIWKACGDVGCEWLCTLFNGIIETGQMPSKFRSSYLIPVYKQKGDVRDCSNYRGIKLMCHTLKIFERIVDKRLRGIASIHDHQCGFQGGLSTTDALQTVKILSEKYREDNKDLHAVFIDLEKAFDRVPRDLIWSAMRAHDIPEAYIQIIMDMYESTTTQVKCAAGTSKTFNIKVGVHQGSALSPFLFNLVMDYLTKNLMSRTLWVVLYADDIALISEDAEKLEFELEQWRKALEENGLRISRDKTEYMHLKFSSNDSQVRGIHLDGNALRNCSEFKYLGSKIADDGTEDSDIAHRISVGWMKWRSLTGVMCDKRMPLHLKGKIYKTVIRPALLYGSECRATTKTHIRKLEVTEMRMLRWSSGLTLRDRVRNENIRQRIKVAPLHEKIEEKTMRWYGHIQRRPTTHITQKALAVNLGTKKKPGRPKATWQGQAEKILKGNNITPNEIQNRKEYNLRTRRADPK